MKHVGNFIIKDTKFEGQGNSGTALEIIETTAQIVNSTFASNKKGLYRQCPFYNPYDGCVQAAFIGGAIIATNSMVGISQSKFEDNKAQAGGVIYASQRSIVNMSGNVFINNDAIFGGGVLLSNNSNVTVEALNEFHNSTTSGVIGCYSSIITIQASRFHDNGAILYDGGVLDSSFSTITIMASEFYNNKVKEAGGVLNSYHDNIIIILASEFYDNRGGCGGVLNSYSSKNIS